MWKRFILGLGFTLLTSSAYAQFLVGGGHIFILSYIPYHCNAACYNGRPGPGAVGGGDPPSFTLNTAYYFPAFSIWGVYGETIDAHPKSDYPPDGRGPQNPNTLFDQIHYRFITIGADYFFRGTDRDSWHMGSGLEYLSMTNLDTGFKYANGVKPIINFGYVWKGLWNIDWDLSWTRQIGKYETNDQSHHFTTQIQHWGIVGLYRF